MEIIRTLLEQQPLMTLFLTIAIGYLLGEVSVSGFSLGVGAVLFVALAIGWLAPNSVPAPMIGTLGLAIFLYAVGIYYGRQFFLGLTSPSGWRANLIALAGVMSSGVATLMFARAGLVPGYSLGLFAGAGTSTPTLQAAIAALGSDDPAVGYSVAYPLGVAVPILFLYLTFGRLKPTLASTASSGLALIEIGVKQPALFGKRLGDVMTVLPAGVQIVAVRRDFRNEPVFPNAIIAENDVLLVVGDTKAVLDQAQMMLGEPAPGRLVQDRRDLDYVGMFASRPAVVGRMLSDLQLPGEKASVVVHVRRGDADLQARPDLVLEFGDRVGVLANRGDFAAMRKFFGDSIKGTAEFSYISIGLGMALGFLIGAVSIPVPGIGTIALGLSGVLIVALVLGNLRRAAGLNWTIPLSANLVLRNLGLTLFLAQVGMSSGPRFAAAVSENGFLMLSLGAIAVITLVVPILRSSKSSSSTSLRRSSERACRVPLRPASARRAWKPHAGRTEVALSKKRPETVRSERTNRSRTTTSAEGRGSIPCLPAKSLGQFINVLSDLLRHAAPRSSGAGNVDRIAAPRRQSRSMHCWRADWPAPSILSMTSSVAA